jgi:hypothetical protein
MHICIKSLFIYIYIYIYIHIYLHILVVLIRQDADLAQQLDELVLRELGQVRSKSIACFDGANIGKREVAHELREQFEAMALQQLYSVVVSRKHLVAGESDACMFVDFEAHVELEKVQELWCVCVF